MMVGFSYEQGLIVVIIVESILLALALVKFIMDNRNKFVRSRRGF